MLYWPRVYDASGNATWREPMNILVCIVYLSSRSVPVMQELSGETQSLVYTDTLDESKWRRIGCSLNPTELIMRKIAGRSRPS